MAVEIPAVVFVRSLTQKCEAPMGNLQSPAGWLFRVRMQLSHYSFAVEEEKEHRRVGRVQSIPLIWSDAAPAEKEFERIFSCGNLYAKGGRTTVQSVA